MLNTETSGNAPSSTRGELHGKGREVWIREAVREHGSSLLRYAMRTLAPGYCEHARDVVQDTFVKLCRAERSEVEDHLAKWLFTVCRNRAFDIMRKEERMMNISTIESGKHGSGERIVTEARGTVNEGDSAVGRVERPETTSRILQALGQLPPNQQDVLRLKFQGGLSYGDIAQATNLSVTNVGFLIHRGLKTLREQFADTEGKRVMNESTHTAP